MFVNAYCQQTYKTFSKLYSQDGRIHLPRLINSYLSLTPLLNKLLFYSHQDQKRTKRQEPAYKRVDIETQQRKLRDYILFCHLITGFPAQNIFPCVKKQKQIQVIVEKDDLPLRAFYPVLHNPREYKYKDEFYRILHV